LLPDNVVEEPFVCSVETVFFCQFSVSWLTFGTLDVSTLILAQRIIDTFAQAQFQVFQPTLRAKTVNESSQKA